MLHIGIRETTETRMINGSQSNSFSLISSHSKETRQERIADTNPVSGWNKDK